MRVVATGLLLCFVALAVAPAVAQVAHHPFAVGANEGAVGAQGGLGAWIIAQESHFYLGLTGAVRAVRSGNGLALLIGLSFAYGVFHAAGPGHGKAIITSYMVSNEVALRRGLAIALAAALLQGVIATAIVGIAAFAFNATGARMTEAAQIAELMSYIGIVGLGLLLVWRKGRALAAVLRPSAKEAPVALAAAGPSLDGMWPRTTISSGRFVADDGHSHGPGCGCGRTHMPEASTLEGQRFDWKAASVAVVTAGARPCSGAILVLVFSLSQGLFLAGVAATFAMALGTAITTGALASAAVFAKDLALRLSGGSGTAILGRLIEFGAAACVLLFGIALLAAALSGVHAGA